ncbi:MAG: hypothetical protein ACT4P7_04295 [Gemmatimonadaceae bacterium]
MKRGVTRFAVGAMVLVLAGASTAGAQQIRSFTTPKGRDRDQSNEIPSEYKPPRGMCRIWIDHVPAKQQPAPTDCATAVRNKPRNGRVIFGEQAEDSKGGDKKGKDGKEKPRKPEGGLDESSG